MPGGCTEGVAKAEQRLAPERHLLVAQAQPLPHGNGLPCMSEGFQGSQRAVGPEGNYHVDALEVLPKRNSVSREGNICASDRRSCCCMASSTPRPPVYSSRCWNT